MKIDELLKAKRIAIFGWPATGKSTLSKLLEDKLDLPLFSLDDLRWKNFNGGKKDDAGFLVEYNNILEQDEWIIEGNALDWIDSRLELSDILIFFESTPEQSIQNYLSRAERIKSGEEKRIGFDLDLNMDSTTKWIRTRYANKIIGLRKKLEKYKHKLILVSDFNELEEIADFINVQTQNHSTLS